MLYGVLRTPKAGEETVSPKNKGKFGKGRSPIAAETDEFLTQMERLIRWLKPHAIKLGIFFGVTGVIVVGYTTWHWWQNRKDAHATALYERATVISQVPIQADDDADKDDTLPPDPRGVPRHYASEKDRAAAELSALDELESKYGGTGVARQGVLLRANALYQLGRYDQAAKAFSDYASSAKSGVLARAAREGKGYALEQKAMNEKDPKAHQADLEQALTAFEAMQPNQGDPGADDALYHQARVLDELGRTQDAIKRFNKLLAAHPNTMLKQEVELRLVALKARPGK